MGSDTRGKKRVVYALLDPRNNAVRYVGISVDAGNRLKQHIPGGRDAHTPKGRWIAELRQQKMEPIIQILESDLSFIGAYQREQYWIRELLKAGADLTNVGFGEEEESVSDIEVLPSSPRGLKQIREAMRPRVTQEMVARRTSRVSLRTYVNAENGKAIKYSTAMDILNAINSLLAERNRQALTLDDLGLNLE